MKNKISIFGASGFIGNRFCEMFPNDVIPIERDNIYSFTPELIWFISTIDNYHVFDNPYLDINTNLSLTIEALELGRTIYGKKLIFNLISTWFSFGNSGVPARENMCCNPKGFYGITALCREQLLASYCNTFELNFRIMRLANTLGIGDKKISAKKNSLQFFVREIVNNRPVNLYWPDKTVRDYIYVDDVCSAINLVISSEQTKNKIYNIGNSVPIKFGDCVEYIVNKTGNNPVAYVERSEFHRIVQTNVMYLDNSKIKRLGYKQTKTIWQILDELIEYYTKEKDG